MGESKIQLPLSKRLLAALFAVVLVAGLIPVSAWAEGGEAQNSATQEQVDDTQEQADEQGGSEDALGGGEASGNSSQDGDLDEPTGSEDASGEGETPDADSDGQEASDTDNNDDQESNSADQDSKETSLSSLEGDLNAADLGDTVLKQYDASFTDLNLYYFLSSNWVSVKGFFRLDGNREVSCYSGSGVFEPKKHGVCTYSVEGQKWPEQLPGQPEWRSFGTLILQEMVTVEDIQDVSYNGQKQALAPIVKGANGRILTLGVDYTLTYSTTKNYTDAGSEITVSVDFQGDFSDESYYPTVTKTYTIQKADVEVDVEGKSETKTYNGSSQSLAGFNVVKTTSDLYDAEKNVTLAEEVKVEGKDVGTYPMNIEKESFVNNNDNFNVTFNVVKNGSLTISPATATVAANSASKTYGQADPEFTATVDGLVGGESKDLIKYTVSRSNTDENADTYNDVIVPTGETSQGNYVVEYAPANFTISQAKVTVTADDSSKVYGDEDPIFAAKVEGLVNGESESLIEYAVSRTNDDEIAGTYEGVIAPKGETSQGNYSVTFVPADFTIGKRAIEVNDSVALEYNGQEQALNIDASKVAGLVDGDKLYLDNAQVKGTELGIYTEVTEYTWKAAKGELDVTNSYDLKVSGELTITAASSNDSDADGNNAGSADSDSSDSADEGEASSETPQTGDSSTSFVVGAGMVAIAAVLAALFVSRRLRGTVRR
ncbi:MAG: MBG domain-containing protein [Coriobacteriia bacterium]|nr:MBG domain-containing protein [Coriobacteriia bacterium]